MNNHNFPIIFILYKGMIGMTVKVELNGTVYFVYNVKSKCEGLALATITNQRKKNGNKSTRIDAYKYFDSDNTYYIKPRMNGDIEINIKNF